MPIGPEQIEEILGHAPDVMRHAKHGATHGMGLFEKGKTKDERLEHGLEVAGGLVGLSLIAAKIWRTLRRKSPDQPQQIDTPKEEK
ncbi:MAG TPA: hypothetical protein VF189_05640 [Patescibacteria group bacterium]